MSDPRNDGWGHRSEMEAHDSEASRGVSAAVNERKAGVEVPERIVEGYLGIGDDRGHEAVHAHDTPADDPTEGEDTEPNWADPDFSKHFEARHLPRDQE